MDSNTRVTVTCSHGRECVVSQETVDRFLKAGTLSEGIMHVHRGKPAGECDATEFHIRRDHEGDRANASGWLVDQAMQAQAAARRAVTP